MMKPAGSLIPVVAVALVDAAGRVLLQQRRHGAHHGGLWEFPGGKVEAGETLERALRREIDEELGLALGHVEAVASSSDPSPEPADRDPHLILLFLCRSWSGEPRALGGEAIAWFDPAEVVMLPLPPLDVSLAAALPQIVARSGDTRERVAKAPGAS